MSIGNPTVNAFLFVLDDKASGKQFDAYIDIVDFQDFASFDFRYRPVGSNDKWTFLNASLSDGSQFGDSVLDYKDMISKQAIIDWLKKCIARFNLVIAEKFGAQDEAPDGGIEFAKWVLRTGKLSENDNVLTFKDF